VLEDTVPPKSRQRQSRRVLVDFAFQDILALEPLHDDSSTRSLDAALHLQFQEGEPQRTHFTILSFRLRRRFPSAVVHPWLQGFVLRDAEQVLLELCEPCLYNVIALCELDALLSLKEQHHLIDINVVGQHDIEHVIAIQRFGDRVRRQG
jgi:hypothetical protein